MAMKDKVNADGGAILKGRASFIDQDTTYNYPVGIVLDAVGE